MSEQLRVASESMEPEIFGTLQGEGRHTGEPATFLRLSECNLQCTWCDTPYTWNFDGTPYKHDDDVKYSRVDQQIKLTVGEAINQITQEQTRRLVISGGEPMLQQATLTELIKGLKNEDPSFKVDIETNGTVTPTDEMVELVDLFTVSPKLASSGNAQHKREKPKALQRFAELDNADFKFVIADESDMYDVLHYQQKYGIKHDKIWLMPEGRTKEQLDRHSQQVAELAIEYGFNLTGRLHIDLWGDKRGV